MSDILLQFDFEQQPYQFKDPIKIWHTYQINNVEAIFDDIETYLSSGYYIAGCLSYEAAPAFDVNYIVSDQSRLPLLWFAAFEKPETLSIPYQQGNYSLSDWECATDFDTYQSGIKRIKDAIAAGDTYQVNYTTRLQANFQGESYSFYQQLRTNQAASYCAYLNLNQFQILSASPELFFRMEDGEITTKPMKGTIRRGKTWKEDKQLKQQLFHSEKDRAENVMIVDLLRNDLGQIAEIGSVKVTNLFDIETYPTVHQMTSTIKAKLTTSKLFDVFKALFPCGSITGAPKIETMKQIAALETEPREVYCGAIGYITPERKAVFNVPIRTVIIEDKRATYGTGGGITWDSTSASEYDELQQKAQILQASHAAYPLLETMKLENGHYPLKDYHQDRLEQSVSYFAYPWNPSLLKQKLQQTAIEYPSGLFRVRLLYDPNGEIDITCKKMEKRTGEQTAILAPFPVDHENRYLYHKTTNRDLYKEIDLVKPAEVFTSLLWNQEGNATEFTIGNLVVEKDGQYFTPPVSDGLLPGTFREKLVREGIITEANIHLSSLTYVDQLWFINSLRGWVKIKLIDYQTNQSPC